MNGHYERAFDEIATRYATPNRDLIASILLDAVEQSFGKDDPSASKARQWLQSVYAQALLRLVDINPDAAMEHLNRKWRRIDGDTAGRLH